MIVMHVYPVYEINIELEPADELVPL